jgi:CubicO group peptidase (beta-lactamase class C family)
MKRPVLFIVAVLALAGCASGEQPATPTGAPSSPPVASAAPAATSAPTSTPAPTPTATPDLEARLDRLFAIDFNGSVLVAKDGEILYAKGIGMADNAKKLANTPETRFRIGSITKQFTGMGILILESRGLVERSDSICDYIDDCPKAWKSVTIEHLLAHTSGIASFTDQPDFDPMTASTPAETVADVADIPLAWEPGRFFGYSNTGYVLLGMVIERASGMSYEQFLGDEIFDPLGMADSGYEDGDTPGLAVGYRYAYAPAAAIDMSIPYAAGGLYSTVLDLQRWADALDTDALVPAAVREQFATPLVETTDRVGFGYGYGVHIGEEDGHRIVAHDGGIDGFYTYFAHYPDDDLTIVLLTNREQAPDLRFTAGVIARAVLDAP